MKFVFLAFSLFLTTLVFGQEISFSELALNDVFLTQTGEEVKFSEVLKNHEGKTVLMDVWAGWCKDCITGMPDVKALQKEFGEVSFIFLSLDKSVKSWEKGIEKYKIEGTHYYVSSGWKGAFCSSIDLDWIPRYMVVNPQGEISLYRAVKADDQRINEALNKQEKQ